jgi:hypothetical protein
MEEIMKYSTQRKVWAFGSLLVMMGSTGEVAAHNQAGSFTTGKRTAVDFYQITCGPDSDRLIFSVKDVTANSSRVVALVHKGSSCPSDAPCARNMADNNDQDSKYSPTTLLKQGEGIYSLFVFHNASGNDRYDVQYHCEDPSGRHTETSIVSRQQQ